MQSALDVFQPRPSTRQLLSRPRHLRVFLHELLEALGGVLAPKVKLAQEVRKETVREPLDEVVVDGVRDVIDDPLCISIPQGQKLESVSQSVSVSCGGKPERT